MRKKKSLGVIVLIIGILACEVTGCRVNPSESTTVTNEIVTLEESKEPDEEPGAVSDAEPAASEPVQTIAPAQTAEPSETPSPEIEEPAAEPGSWHEATKSHNITINTILNYDGKSIYNFNDTVAVGFCPESNVVSTAETETGFILSVIDDDSVKVSFYNHGTENIKPVKLTAEMLETDYINETGATEYVIDGYSSCINGFGAIEMILSDGHIVRAGVLLEDGQLYAANLSTNQQKAQNIVDFRIAMDAILAERNIRPDNSTYTEPIYYPIVPVVDGECIDTDFWVAKSYELVESDWTDAHKVKAFYDYVVENMAYDYWVIGQGLYSRSGFYKDYTGTYFTSVTGVGVCEDFANIIAIMCRAQGIPSTKVFTGKHAWTYIYIADYGRWITVDATRDMIYGCYDEDPSVRTSVGTVARYTTFDNISAENAHYSNLDACIGNDADMERYGKVPVELQELQDT